MRRRILTPQAKAQADLDKNAHTRLVASQVAAFLLECAQWVGTVTTDMVPAASAQVTYLNYARLSLGEPVVLLDALGHDTDYSHVKLLVCGAVSFALPGVSRSAYNYQRGHARVYVLVELNMHPLRPITRWVPAERLQRKLAWKGIT